MTVVRALGRAALAVLALGASGCAEPPAAPVPRRGLGVGTVARVGDEAVGGALVTAIATRQRIAIGEALDRAIFDALLSAEARRSAESAAPGVVWAIEAELGHHVLRELWLRARATPPTADELGEATERHWIDLARPEGFRVVHAVVMARQGEVDDATRRRARELAALVREKLEPVAERVRAMVPPEYSEEERFSSSRGRGKDRAVPLVQDAVRDVPRGKLEVRVEELCPVSADGWHIDRDSNAALDQRFARAAASLERRGDLSPVVETDWGMHVIVLLGRTEPLALPEAARRARLQDEIWQSRAARAKKELLAKLAATARVEVMLNADALLEQVSVAPAQTEGGGG
ncbi:MAG: hypothetical protein HY744_06185 [Deltaproteobacteria bacterium]|nr:hypothetical protein [Deltaproteobacteria bacterium]